MGWIHGVGAWFWSVTPALQERPQSTPVGKLIDLCSPWLMAFWSPWSESQVRQGGSESLVQVFMGDSHGAWDWLDRQSCIMLTATSMFEYQSLED